MQQVPTTIAKIFSAALQEQRSGRLDAAERLYRQILVVYPSHADSMHMLGLIAHQTGRSDVGIAILRDAVSINPADAAVHSNLGNVLAERGHFREAEACYREALRLRPGFFEARSNLGNALKAQDRLDDAVLEYRRAIELQPDFAEAHSNLGSALQQQGRVSESVTCYRRAVALQPDFAQAHDNLGMALLALGEMTEGWEEYEWRWQAPQMAGARRNFSQPQWHGGAGHGRTLLLHAEQGFGDTLQFCRYAPQVAALGFRVIMEAPAPLIGLLRCLRGIDLLVREGEALPDFDLHCPLLSISRAIGTTIATVPGIVPYLYPNCSLVEEWRLRLPARAASGFRVGIAWAGNSRADSPPLAAIDLRRSIDPARLSPLFDTPGVQFFSLQKYGPAAPANLNLIDFMPEVSDFADTAALIANLDHVLSVDTAVAHLAAALGKPVWLLDRFDPCWRWLIGRRDSPWYPTLRIYRQPKPSDWDSILAEVCQDLRALQQPTTIG